MLRLLVLTSIFFTFSTYAQTVLCLGDSLTEGYQLDKEEAFPALIEKNLKSKFPQLKVINGGVAGATSASALKRLDWYLKAKPTHMVLALGANDGLRGFDVQETEKNLAKVIEVAQSQNIKVLLAGMKMPSNYGGPYRKDFEAVYSRLSKKYQVRLLPFLLEGVGGVARLNLADGIHPNSEGYKVISTTVIKYLEPML